MRNRFMPVPIVKLSDLRLSEVLMAKQFESQCGKIKKNVRKA